MKYEIAQIKALEIINMICTESESDGSTVLFFESDDYEDLEEKIIKILMNTTSA